MTPGTVGIVVALPQECRSLSSKAATAGAGCFRDQNTLICVSGVGHDNARHAAQQLIESGAHALVSWGCAAGLIATLKPGDLCVPATVVDSSSGVYEATPEWHSDVVETLRAEFFPCTARLATGRGMVADPAAKHAFGRTHGAVAADMESASVAAMAAERGLPFLAIRSIADAATMTLPRAVLLATTSTGSLRLGAFAAHALRYPADWPALMHLAWSFRTAMRTLTRVRRCLGDGLGLRPGLVTAAAP